MVVSNYVDKSQINITDGRYVVAGSYFVKVGSFSQSYLRRSHKIEEAILITFGRLSYCKGTVIYTNYF